MIRLNDATKEEMNIIVASPMIESSSNSSAKTLSEFEDLALNKILSDKSFYAALESIVFDYLIHGGYLINISMVHTHHGENHIILI